MFLKENILQDIHLIFIIPNDLTLNGSILGKLKTQGLTLGHLVPKLVEIGSVDLENLFNALSSQTDKETDRQIDKWTGR